MTGPEMLVPGASQKSQLVMTTIDLSQHLASTLSSVEAVFKNLSPAPNDGLYYLLNVGAEKYLDVQGIRTEDGVRIMAYTRNTPSTMNQLVRPCPCFLCFSLNSLQFSGSTIDSRLKGSSLLYRVGMRRSSCDHQLWLQ